MLVSVRVAIFLAICSALSIEAKAQDAHELAQEVRSVTANNDRTSSRFIVELKSAPDGMEPTEVLLDFDREGKYVRSRSTMRYMTPHGFRLQGGWKYKTPQSIFFYSSVAYPNNPELVPKHAYSAWLESKRPAPRPNEAFRLVEFMYGLDYISGLYWFELLELPDSKTSVSASGGEAELCVDNPRHGVFRFLFENGRLSQVHCSKTSEQIDQSKYKFVAYSCSLTSINYTSLGQRSLIESYEQELTTTREVDEQKTERTVAHSIRRVSVSQLNKRLSSRIVFEGVEIPDGTPVRVSNDKGIPYQLRDGLLVRVVEKSPVTETEDVQLRSRRGMGAWPYWIGGCVLLSALSCLIYWRLR